MAEESGRGLAESGTERVSQAALSCMPLQQPRDEGRGQLVVDIVDSPLMFIVGQL